MDSNGTNGHERWPGEGAGAVATRTYRREAAPKRLLGSGLFLLDATRRRPFGRAVLWTLVGLIGFSGVGLLAYPIVTDVIADRRQDSLRDEFAEISADEWKATYNAQEVRPEGSPLTRIRIKKLGVNVIVVEGVTGNALRAGVGHYPETALPGDPTGNVVIAGHRTGFGEPFRNVDRLTAGDRIDLITPIGRFVYEVMANVDGHENPWVTSASDWSVTYQTPTPTLTLTTCDPPGTSRDRLIVRARLIETHPAV